MSPRAALRVALVAAWLGAALLVAAVVAPAAFAVLPSRTLAGDLVGRVLPSLLWGGVVVAALVFVMREGPDASRPARRAARIGAPLTIALASLASLLVVDPRIQALRSSGTAIDALPVDDARRVLFGRLHLVSVALLAAAMIAAIAALVVEWRGARAAAGTR